MIEFLIVLQACLAVLGTIVLYYVTKKIYKSTGHKLYLQPILLCPIILSATLLFMGIEYPEYAAGGNLITFMLTPATVAFAVPLYKYKDVVRKHGLRLTVIIAMACTVAMSTSMGLGNLVGLDHSLEMSLAPRSVTTPLAISASTILGGNPTVTAVLVIVTGIIGMIMASLLIKRNGIHNYILKGLLLGITAHGTGTAKAYEDGNKTGVIASIAMIFMGIITTLLVPAVAGFNL